MRKIIEKYTAKDIWENSDLTTLDNDKLRYRVSNALSNVPKPIVDRILSECLFLMPTIEEMGVYVPKKLIKGKAIIALPEKLLERDEQTVILTILNEVSHHYLNHKSLLLEEKPMEEYHKQEVDAESLAKQWLSLTEG